MIFKEKSHERTSDFNSGIDNVTFVSETSTGEYLPTL